MSITFGLFDSFDQGDSTPGQVIANRLDFAVEAERAGIAHYHVTEHHGTPLSVCPSPNLFLAALSQRTTTMRIGALVHVLPNVRRCGWRRRSPSSTSSPSRPSFDMGVGSGVSPYELGYFGVDAANARARFTETLKVVTDALATGRMRHKGTLLRDYDVELSVMPVQRPYPPLWYVVQQRTTAEWAAANSVSLVGRWNGGAFAESARALLAAWRARPAPPPPRLPRLASPRTSTSARPTPRPSSGSARPTTCTSASSPSCGMTTATMARPALRHRRRPSPTATPWSAPRRQ